MLHLLQRPEPGAPATRRWCATVRKVFAAMRIRFEPEPDVCPTAAFEPDELAWPRVVRRAFSDPRVPHESTGVEGRGTEEVKTNDVTGRVGPGEVGFTIELGRPGVGVRFREIQEMCRALARAGVAFEKKNPVTSLMSDVATGTIREDILNEKVLSAIVEIKVPVERAEEIIRLVWDVEKRLDTVVTIGAGVRCDDAGRRHGRRADPRAARLQPRTRQDQHRPRPPRGDAAPSAAGRARW